MAQLLEQIESQKLRLLSIRENRTFPLQGHSTAIVSPAYCILNSEQVDAWSRLIQLEHEDRCDLLKHFCDTQIKLLHFRDQLTRSLHTFGRRSCRQSMGKHATSATTGGSERTANEIDCRSCVRMLDLTVSDALRSLYICC